MLLNNISFLATSFMPDAGTKTAEGVDGLYLFLIISSLISFIIMIGGMTVFIIKYKRKSDNDKTPYITHNTLAEFLWSFIPFVIMMVIFVWGWILFHDLRKNFADEDVLQVNVTAEQWQWVYQYENGHKIVSPDPVQKVGETSLKHPIPLIVPVNTKVRLIISSKDVLHSFFIPAFRNKIDAVPGTYNHLTFESDKIGEYLVYCTEYCGISHSNMLSAIKVVSKEEFAKWYDNVNLASDADLTPVELGKKLYGEKACAGCHSLDGSRVVGPTFKGLFGSKRELESLPSVTADESYIRESLLVPTAKIAKSYPPAMPSFQGQLTDVEITALIEFIKTVK